MKSKFFLLLLLLLSAAPSDAQVTISGRVVNAETKEPVPYAFVRRYRTNRGAITNDEGYFTLQCLPEDSLQISFVSFEKRVIPASYFQENEIFYLQPSKNELSTVEVFGDYDFLYDLVDQSRQKLKQLEKVESKTYFSLETASEGTPVELIECYYNATVDYSGLRNLSLKNGRIGMSKIDSAFFASLSTTQVVSDYHLTNKQDIYFPMNPLHLSRRKLAKYYDATLVSVRNGIYQIEMIPKEMPNSYFNANLWINKKSAQLLQITLSKKNLRKHPFREIDARHRMERINFEMSYTFSEEAPYSLSKVEINYDFEYNNRISRRDLRSNGVFLFFDKDEQFDLPYYDQSDHRLSDYDRIVSQPYNKLFWDRNVVISPSKKSEFYKAYFEENGVLLNFNNLSKKNENFRNRIRSWSKSRFTLDVLNSEVPMGSGSKKEYDPLLATNFYDLQGYIYLDRNEEEDTTYYRSETLVNAATSFYMLPENKYTACFINIYYDLIEVERRDMMKLLNERFWTKKQVDSIYFKTHEKVDETLNDYWIAVNHGKHERAMRAYVFYIRDELGIDNMLLVWNEFRPRGRAVPESAAEWITHFNTGTLLLRNYKNKEALVELLLAEEKGCTLAAMYYNIGLCYFKMDQEELGCPYFEKVEEIKGEYVPNQLRNTCAYSR